MKTFLALLLLIPSLSLGEHNPVAVELRAKIEKEFREAGYYKRSKYEEYSYQSELKKIETQKSLIPNNPLTKHNEQMFKEKEEFRIFNITKKILENNYFKIKDELAKTYDVQNGQVLSFDLYPDVKERKVLEDKLKEAKKIYTLYVLGDEYEMAECWENRNCEPFIGGSSNTKLKLPENYIYVEPPSVDIYIDVQPSADRYIID
jgi:hypothetical protein